MFESTLDRLNSRLIVRLLRENFRLQLPNYSIAMVAMVAIAATTALTAWIMKDIIDSMIESGNRAQVFGVAASVALIFTIKGIATYTQTVFLSRAGNSIVAAQQRRLYAAILKHGVAFFTERDSSDLLMRVTYSAQAARTVVETLVMGFVRDLLTLIGLIVVMVYQQPTLSLFSLLFGPIALYGVRRILARVREIMQAEMTSMAEIIKVIQETAVGIRVVKAFALEDRMNLRMKSAVANVEDRANALARLEAATSPLMETLSGFAIAAVVALSVVNLFGEDASTPGQLMSFVTALLMAYEPAKRLARMRVTIEAGMIGVGVMYEVVDMPVTLVESENARGLPSGASAVHLQDVHFEYKDDQTILNGLDIEFPAGKTTALVGPSGGGKSTIMNLIMRMYDPTRGSVEIGDVDLREATFASLREKIAFVGQDTFLFSGTIRQNIALGKPETTDEEIIAAAKAAHAHDFISQFELGYDTIVGENGASLSGGQRQRLAIARAVLRDSPILLMDEATSALDSESEHLVKQALDDLTKGRTTIVIAHRLSTIINSDLILVIKDGKVEEQGDLNTLLAQKGLFRRLYDRQYEKAEPRS
ncbi:ABC transporter ATP-binding protein/permease [Tateyamaria omphalii]|uniref:ABC transporter ATP-binding protein n=1 Tax=Tateyamaria omphalii TaxID=299262 RepID=UPI001C999379|nr:ABC transporter ATP-binding protein [Tateyamaria omphalii]MBY5934985.1 ABC transporter ATP-binding protein/permease [Tateyamaria omphalii]